LVADRRHSRTLAVFATSIEFRPTLQRLDCRIVAAHGKDSEIAPHRHHYSGRLDRGDRSALRRQAL